MNFQKNKNINTIIQECNYNHITISKEINKLFNTSNQNFLVKSKKYRELKVLVFKKKSKYLIKLPLSEKKGNCRNSLFYTRLQTFKRYCKMNNIKPKFKFIFSIKDISKQELKKYYSESNIKLMKN